MSTVTTPPEAGTRAGLVWAAAAVVLSVAVLALVLAGAARSERLTAERQHRERIDAARTAARAEGRLFVERATGELPAVDPSSPQWAAAAAIEVPLQRQTIAMPMLDTATVAAAELRGLTDGERISWRVAWTDPSPAMNVDAGRFSDAVALQFPIGLSATFSMGDDGEAVQILHWKGLWQKDLDEHFQDVQDLHPNYWADLYWFATGDRPFRIPDAFSDPRSRAWFVGLAAGNPMSAFDRLFPCEELVAEGFGSLTHQAESSTAARGQWRDGSWEVVFTRPLQTADRLDTQFWLGGSGTVAIAVWDGEAGNVGGRKHWSNWVDYELSP